MNLNPADQILITESDTTAQAIHCYTITAFEMAVSTLTQDQQSWVSQHQFKAEAKTFIRIPGIEQDMLWLGLGEGEHLQRRNSSAWLSQQLPTATYEFDEPDKELLLGWALGQYRFEYYKAESKKTNQLLVSKAVQEELRGLINGIFICRDLVNTPTNDMGPNELAEFSKTLAIEHGANFSQVLDDELLVKGYRTIYAVGQAADNRPRLIDLTWGDESHPKITLVGKGVCFDTGGLDIKPSSGMRIMKKDMGGAAHALGLASMLMTANLPIRLRVLIPAVENSISSNAYRPGDIIKTYQGSTVEIDNTDAEGRLVLCDALTLACEETPDLLLDFATLTGAARVALGTGVVPYFTDDDDLVNDLNAHAKLVDDPIWQLPLFSGYEDDLKSPVADMSNMGKGPFGGAITAALFLKHFVAENISWAHFDLYGWNSATKPTCPEGGQAMAIHGIYSLLKARYSKE